jgi:cell division protein DivIC
MFKIKKYIRNKYFIATCIFLIYSLFLDDIDLFTIIDQKQKLSKLGATHSELQSKLNETKISLSKINNRSELEHYAREVKLFKKENEEIFVISYE